MPPKIDLRKCDGCGICVYDCGAWCLSLDLDTEKVVLSNGRDCVDCFICEEVCPEDAISMKVGKGR